MHPEWSVDDQSPAGGPPAVPERPSVAEPSPVDDRRPVSLRAPLRRRITVCNRPIVHQLSLELSVDGDTEPGSADEVEEARHTLQTLSPGRACTFLVRMRGEKSAAYRRALVVLGKRVAKRARDGQERRRLLWAVAEFQAELGDLAGAADSYHAAAVGLDDRSGSALVLACARGRGLCLDRLGCFEEAKAEYARFRRAAGRYGDAVKAGLEQRLAEMQDDYGFVGRSAVSWRNAALHFKACGQWSNAAEAELQEGSSLMYGACPRQAARALARARRLFTELGDARNVARASMHLVELYSLWGKPRRRLAAADHAYSSYLDCGDGYSAARAKRECAYALAELGRTTERDEAFAASLAIMDALTEWTEGCCSDLYRGCSAEIRLEYGTALIGDGKYREGLEHMSAGVERMTSLAEVSRLRLPCILHAIGTARERLGPPEAPLVRRLDDSPPLPGYRLLPVDSPRLLLCLAQSVERN